MIRTLFLIATHFSVFAVVQNSDLQPLLTATGPGFRSQFDFLSSDPSKIDQLRKISFSELDGASLRFEFLRRQILARAMDPAVYTSFDEFISFDHFGSPLSPKINQDEPVDEQIIRVYLDYWSQNVPWKDDWNHLPFKGLVPDPKMREDHIWPPITFGLYADPARLRRLMAPEYMELVKRDNYSELALEGLLWLCERTSFDPFVTIRYRVMLSIGLSQCPDIDKVRFIKRYLSILQIGDQFGYSGNEITILPILNKAEMYGNISLVAEIDKLKNISMWKPYRDIIAEVSNNLFIKSEDKSRCIERELSDVETLADYVKINPDKTIPEYLSDANKFGNLSNITILNRLANNPEIQKYRPKIMEIIAHLEEKCTTK